MKNFLSVFHTPGSAPGSLPADSRGGDRTDPVLFPNHLPGQVNASARDKNNRTDSGGREAFLKEIMPRCRAQRKGMAALLLAGIFMLSPDLPVLAGEELAAEKETPEKSAEGKGMQGENASSSICSVSTVSLPSSTVVEKDETAAPSPAQEKAAPVSDAGASPAQPLDVMEKNGWVFCENLVLGLKTGIGRAYVRQVRDFETEIFFADGVATSLLERFPEAVRELLKKIPTPPAGGPPEFAPPPDLYRQFTEKIRIGDSIEELFAKLGTAYAGKPLFDLYSRRIINEYYWKSENEKWLFGAVLNDDYTIEKSLIRKIPELWR